MSSLLSEPAIENVILVDECDHPIGIGEKLAIHREGKLHRAVSVFLFNRERQLLIQQRAFSKYHSGGLWTNTCCGHPRPGESEIDAAQRRLWEEMGIRCVLEKLFDFTYKAVLDNHLIEHEFDHVFIGDFNGKPQLNPEEANAAKWIDLEDLLKDVRESPERYTVWFKIILQRVVDKLLS